MENTHNSKYEILLKNFKELLKKSGLKFTSQREAILKTLYEMSGHYTPEDLHILIKQRCPDLNIGIATVYRTLNLLESSNETVELPVIGDEENRNAISLEIVHSVILARVEEAMMILAKSLEKSALREQVGAGVVLTGGMTKLKGIRELGQAIFHGMPVRIGLPREMKGMYDEMKDPSYATVIGLILYQAGEHTQYEVDYSKTMLHHKELTEEKGLKDLELGQGADGSSTARSHASNEQEESVSVYETDTLSQGKGPESDDFSFDDLPKPEKNGRNLFAKFINWAKQLF
jgi:cell division protein FtsA